MHMAKLHLLILCYRMQRDPTETCVEVLTSALAEHLPNPDTSGGLLLVEVDDASAVSHLFREILFYFSPLSPMPCR